MLVIHHYSNTAMQNTSTLSLCLCVLLASRVHVYFWELCVLVPTIQQTRQVSTKQTTETQLGK